MYFTCTIYDIVLPNKYLSIYLSDEDINLCEKACPIDFDL